MSQLILPSSGPLATVSAWEYQRQVLQSIAAAILDQPEGLDFPSLERLCGRFGINRDTALRMRTALADTGHLHQLDHLYVTAHPQPGNDTEHTGGEQS
ncbi:hypothetical protein AB0A63_31565 [Lentzea sp. NPDC042327]|uniref:hypothetical protein n=1 Tax=Lentzea sp. NPDC042327 TaxID=3154801 RepID=UPI0033F6D777